MDLQVNNKYKNIAFYENLKKIVQIGLEEDIGTGDITSDSTIPNVNSTAYVTCKEKAILCGIEWFNEVFFQLSKNIIIDWMNKKDGDIIYPNEIIAKIYGNTKVILKGERTALNFLQMLSGTSTITNIFVNKLKFTNIKLLDTRKTIPGFRLAQKYAVICGGGYNHRFGLYDSFLIKENHLLFNNIDKIKNIIQNIKNKNKNTLIEIEVTSINEFKKIINCSVDIIMLDNFTISMIKETLIIAKNYPKIKIDISGNITLKNIHEYLKLKVNFISIGSITKNINAIDLSLIIIYPDK